MNMIITLIANGTALRGVTSLFKELNGFLGSEHGGWIWPVTSSLLLFRSLSWCFLVAVPLGIN